MARAQRKAFVANPDVQQKEDFKGDHASRLDISCIRKFRSSHVSEEKKAAFYLTRNTLLGQYILGDLLEVSTI